MSEDKISAVLEQVSNKGCDYCHQVLAKIKNKQIPDELVILSKTEQDKFFSELASIIEVYDKTK